MMAAFCSVVRGAMPAVAQGGGGGASDEPLYTGAANQTLVFAGDSSSANLASLTAAGAADTEMKFCPFPSQNTSSSAEDTTANDIVTGIGGTGKALYNFWPASPSANADVGARWDLVRTPNYTGVKTQIVRYYAKLDGTFSSFIEVKWMYMSDNVNPGGGFPLWCVHLIAPCDSTNAPPGIESFWQCYNAGIADTVGQNQATQPVGPYFEDLMGDGQWHRFVHLFRPHASSGNKNGRMAMWIDGTKIMDLRGANVPVTPPGGWKTWCSQEQVDTMNVATESDNFTTIIHGSVESSENSPAWSQTINVGDGDASNVETYAYWLED